MASAPAAPAATESAVAAEPAADAVTATATTKPTVAAANTGPAVAASATTTEPVVAATTTGPAVAASATTTTEPVVAATTTSGPVVAAVTTEPAAAAVAATTTKPAVAATATTTTGPAVAATTTVTTKPKTTTTVVQDAPKPAARDSVSVPQPTKAQTTQPKTRNDQQATQATSTTTPPRLLNTTRAVTPPVLHDAMELNEWAVGLSFLEVVKPSQFLLDHLLLAVEGGEDNSTNGVDCVWQTVLVPVLNKTLLRLSQEHLTEKTTRKAPVVVQTGQVAGLVQVQGELTPDKQLCKVVVAFFYHALEAVLYCEKKRWKVPNNKEQHNSSTGDTTMPTTVAMMQDEETATPTENVGVAVSSSCIA